MILCQLAVEIAFGVFKFCKLIINISTPTAINLFTGSSFKINTQLKKWSTLEKIQALVLTCRF